MKTLVFHPIDATTDFLSNVYKNKDYTIIRHIPSKSKIKKLIKEHDRIILLGHGTERGLLYNYIPHFYNHSIIGSEYVYLLREKNCIGIFCYASEFFEQYKLKGFATGMFISDIDEAYSFNVNTNKDELNESNILLANAINKYIDSDNMYQDVINMYYLDTHVCKFNRELIKQF